MSWIIKEIITGSPLIRSNLIKVEGREINVDYENEDYIKLLRIERAIKELFAKGYLTEQEVEIVKYMANGETFSSLSKKLNVSRFYIRNLFNDICNRLAYALGNEFTNEGYAEYIINKYNLNDEQADLLLRKLKGEL